MVGAGLGGTGGTQDSDWHLQSTHSMPGPWLGVTPILQTSAARPLGLRNHVHIRWSGLCHSPCSVTQDIPEVDLCGTCPCSYWCVHHYFTWILSLTSIYLFYLHVGKNSLFGMCSEIWGLKPRIKNRYFFNWSSSNIKLTTFKWTIQWHLGHSRCWQLPPVFHSRLFSSPWRETLYPSAGTTHLSLPHLLATTSLLPVSKDAYPGHFI